LSSTFRNYKTPEPRFRALLGQALKIEIGLV
jgi:hypothetical protein